jgi:hypothetical protein
VRCKRQRLAVLAQKPGVKEDQPGTCAAAASP